MSDAAFGRLWYALAAAILALATAGAVAAGAILTGSSAFAGRAEIGTAVKTSFGTVSVEHVEPVRGISHRAMGGMPMGSMPEMVGHDDMLIQAAVRITNLSSEAVSYDPRRFDLSIDGRRRARKFGASVEPGHLRPDSAIDVRLGFVVPRRDARFTVEFHDPKREDPITIDLGRFDLGGHRRARGNHSH